MTENVDLRALLLGRQTTLRAALEVGRGIHTHPGTKGDGSELAWATALEKFLPRRYAVEHCFVVNSDGRRSDQIDLAIYDPQYTPILFEDDGAKYITAESVYAVFEIKQEFSKENFEYASEKVASVRELRRVSTDVHHIGGVEPKADPKPILGGLLAYQSSWNPPLGDPFRDALLAAPPEGRLDLGCALVSGAFELVPGEDEPRVVGEDESLIFFMLRLFRRLQLLATVGAIDIEAYARSIEAHEVGG